jgi:RNA polymerase sigma-70 factor (ECF subfamily)
VDVIAEVLQRDQRRSVLAAVTALPPGQREAIELAYFDGYSQAEIATRTGLPLGTVKSRTRAAMRALAASPASLRTLAGPAADGPGAGPRE